MKLSCCRAFAALCLVVVSSACMPADAQDSSNQIGSEYVPGDALATVVVDVADTLRSPMAEMYPVEVVDAWCEQNFGIPAQQIDQVKVVLGVPGEAGPMFAAVISSKSDVNVQSISQKFVDTTQAIDVDGLACYPVVQAPGVVVHAKDARTVVLASSNYLATVVRSAGASSTRGPLAAMASSVPHTGNMTALVAIEPIRPMAMGMLQAQAEQVPPPFRPFTKIPELLEAVLLRVNLADQQNGLNLVMLGEDEAAAEELLGIITNGLEMGRQIGLAQAMSGIQEDDPMAEATRQYMQRMANNLVKWLTPTRDGRRLSLSGSATQGVATQGVLVALLLPAVQAARQAARRQASSNNLKMIGLAMHNYHDAYRHFPDDIKAADGTPLLSWRVAILPFIEEAALYDQFRKEEPWDSPHNLKLAEQMPAIFVHPGIPAAPGTTVYQRPLGENYIAGGDSATRIQDITDGTSNTILAVETSGEAAVPWTRPADVTIDPQDPLANLRNNIQQGFQSLFADGSVRFIANAVDPTVFQALLTRNGGEIVRE